MNPATIKIFLTDGNPEGIRTAELSNWTGKAIAGPRSELADLLKRDELTNPGVYFLHGIDPESDKPILYIGEAESVKKHLHQHKDRDDWNQIVAFVSKDENLTKAHIRYLEGELIVQANKMGNAVVQNSASSGAKLPESDKADMDVFLEKMLQLLPILGIDLFKPIDAGKKESDSVLMGTIKGLVAKGNRTSGGFVVYKGSQAVKEHRPSAVNAAKKREGLIQEGKLLDKGDHYEFSTDIEFGSPSTGGTVVCGGATNGLKFWRNAAGQMLKDLEDQPDD